MLRFAFDTIRESSKLMNHGERGREGRTRCLRHGTYPRAAPLPFGAERLSLWWTEHDVDEVIRAIRVERFVRHESAVDDGSK